MPPSYLKVNLELLQHFGAQSLWHQTLRTIEHHGIITHKQGHLMFLDHLEIIITKQKTDFGEYRKCLLFSNIIDHTLICKTAQEF